MDLSEIGSVLKFIALESFFLTTILIHLKQASESIGALVNNIGSLLRLDERPQRPILHIILRKIIHIDAATYKSNHLKVNADWGQYSNVQENKFTSNHHQTILLFAYEHKRLKLWERERNLQDSTADRKLIQVGQNFSQ